MALDRQCGQVTGSSSSSRGQGYPEERALSFDRADQMLSLQLAQAVARSRFTICDSCYEPYQRRGRRNYCPDCRGTRAASVRKRASREARS